MTCSNNRYARVLYRVSIGNNSTNAKVISVLLSDQIDVVNCSVVVMIIIVFFFVDGHCTARFLLFVDDGSLSSR
jgi:hypothetical protein